MREMLTGTEIAIAGLAAAAAGAVNALAGGGTLISFPALMALGVPGISANVTNTVALCPGYLGGALGQRDDLRGQRKRLLLFVPVGILGGLLGGTLLLSIGEGFFRILVPFLILLASGLLATENRIRKWMGEREKKSVTGSGKEAMVPVGLAGIYGGFFGAGLSVIILAVLALFLDDSMTRLNALKQCISLGVNTAAAILFIFSGMISWPLVLVMVTGALAGGMLGGTLASWIDPVKLKWTIVYAGLIISAIFFIQLFEVPA